LSFLHYVLVLILLLNIVICTVICIFYFPICFFFLSFLLMTTAGTLEISCTYSLLKSCFYSFFFLALLHISHSTLFTLPLLILCLLFKIISFRILISNILQISLHRFIEAYSSCYLLFYFSVVDILVLFLSLFISSFPFLRCGICHSFLCQNYIDTYFGMCLINDVLNRRINSEIWQNQVTSGFTGALDGNSAPVWQLTMIIITASDVISWCKALDNCKQSLMIMDESPSSCSQLIPLGVIYFTVGLL
jgi:hypothetical protein